MGLPRLYRIPELAKELDIPAESLRRAADEHGKLVQFGRAARILEDDIRELIDLCRVRGKAPDFTMSIEKAERPSGKSAMARPASRPGLTTAKKLKQNSQSTSKGNSAQLAPRNHRN